MRFGLLFIVASLGCAQDAKLPESFRSLVDISRGAPPEFGADALLRLVESGQISDPGVRRDLVEQAFGSAISAKFPIRKRHLPGTTLDSRAGSLAQAYGLKLDALSLESRAVSDMLRIDPAAARKLLQSIPPPRFDPLSCDDALFYDVADFYQAVGSVVNSAFTPQERAKEEDVNFLLDYIGQATNPAQLVPLARAIQGAGVNNAQREILWTKFNAMLPNLQADDRSVSGLLSDPQGMDFIATAIRARSGGCKDDASAGTQPKISATSSGATPKVERYWQSAEAQRMLDDGKKLRYGDAGRVLTEAERSTPEWQQRLTDYLSALAAWGPGEEKSEADYYNEKSTVYIALVELIPPGPQRDKMLDAFIDFINNSPLQQQSPVEWYNQASFMLERVRGTRDGEPTKVRAAFERSGNAILILEAALDKILGTRPPS
jgi:hypothetical protein